GHQADLGLSAGAAGGPDRGGDLSVDIDRIPVGVVEWEMADEWDAKPVQTRIGQDARQLRRADAAEFPQAQRRRLSRSCQRRLRRPRLYLVADLCALPAICLLPCKPKHR